MQDRRACAAGYLQDSGLAGLPSVACGRVPGLGAGVVSMVVARRGAVSGCFRYRDRASWGRSERLVTLGSAQEGRCLARCMPGLQGLTIGQEPDATRSPLGLRGVYEAQGVPSPRRRARRHAQQWRRHRSAASARTLRPVMAEPQSIRQVARRKPAPLGGSAPAPAPVKRARCPIRYTDEAPAHQHGERGLRCWPCEGVGRLASGVAMWSQRRRYVTAPTVVGSAWRPRVPA